MRKVEALLDGKRPLNDELAARLALHFGTAPEFWLNLQSACDIETAYQPVTSSIWHFERITVNQTALGGKPCIRGLRVTVGMVVGELGAGRTMEELLADYPYLEEADIREALAYAAELAEGHELASEA